MKSKDGKLIKYLETTLTNLDPNEFSVQGIGFPSGVTSTPPEDANLYISDTGIRWDGYKNRILDFVDADYYKKEKIIARDTNQLINIITENRYPRLNILVHPANWIDPIFSWCKWRLLQYLRNFGKKIIIHPWN